MATRRQGRARYRSGLAAGLVSAALVLGSAPLVRAAEVPAAGAAQARPLAPALEALRARQATEIYGDSAQRPMADRKTALISLGDSEISGEGVGSYEPGTDGPDNWCHRSSEAAIHRTGIDTDLTYNVACSGASTVNIRIGGEKQYDDELVQSDSLAIVARNTRLTMLTLVVGANDDLRFGPVMSDCVSRWLNPLQGPCAPTYAPGWQSRIDGLVPKVEATVGDLRRVMREAGYRDDAYRLVLMDYPSPVGPDGRDNPAYRGKLLGGCTLHDEDLAWGRNSAVPALATGLRAAARNSGADFLDASRLFHGHEGCMEDPWALGLTVNPINPVPPDGNSVRQSFHPNARGHGAFASCLTQLHASSLREAACADPYGIGTVRLYGGAWDDAFAPLRQVATGSCLAVADSSTRIGTGVGGQSCDGGREPAAAAARGQRWWYDPRGRTIHTALTHDRCLEVPDGPPTAGARVSLGNCTGVDAQRFVRDEESGVISSAMARRLCLTLTGPLAPLTLETCDGSDRQRFA